MQQLEQEEDENAAAELRARLAPIASGLLAGRWMLHRERTVRLLVACCLSQILRLYAPDPPYDGEGLGKVFSLLVQQLRGLSEPSGTYYSHYFSLLESLATVKSVVLIWEVGEEEMGGREAVLLELVKTVLALVHPKLSATARVYLAEVLEAVLVECPQGASLPEPALAALLGALTGTDKAQSAFVTELLSHSETASIFGAMFARHFSDTLLSHASTPAFEAVRQVHAQASALAACAADSLIGVLPQIAQELEVEASDIRTLAVQTLAAIFSRLSYGQVSGVWGAWLQRAQDRVPGLRAQWVVAAAQLLGQLGAEGRNDRHMSTSLASALADRLMDPEERVRERVLLALTQHVPCPEALPRVLVEAIAERCLDRREDVRVPALTFLCGLLRRLDISPSIPTQEIRLELQSRVDTWSFLANKLIRLLWTDDRDCRLLCEYFIEHSVLSVDLMEERETLFSDEVIRVQALRWSWFWAALDADGRATLARWLKSKGVLAKLVKVLMALADAGLAIDSRQMLTYLPHAIERFRADQPAPAMLNALLSEEGAALRPAFNAIIDPQSSIDAVNAAHAAITAPRRGATALKPYLLQYLAIKAGWLSINRSLMAQLLSLSATQAHASLPSLLEMLLAEAPDLAAADHGPVLVKAACDAQLSVHSLRALSHFLASDTSSTQMSTPPAFLASIKALLASSRCRRQVKYATRILLAFDHMAAPEILETAAADTAHPDGFVKLRAWQQLAVLAASSPALLPPYLDELLLEYEVLLVDATPELRRLATKFWAALLPILPTRLSTAGRSYIDELASGMLNALPGAAKEADLASVLLRTLLALLGPRCSLSALLERPALLAALESASERTVGKLVGAVVGGRATPIALLLLLPSGKDTGRVKSLLLQALRAWSRANSAASEGESEHVVDSSALSIPEDLLLPLLILLARCKTVEDADITRMRSTINIFLDLVQGEDSTSTFAYLFALAVEAKRYRLAPYLVSNADSQLNDKALYLASELAQACIRQRVAAQHAALDAFPLPLRVSDTCLAPLESDLASRNLARSYLASRQRPTGLKRFGATAKKDTEESGSLSTSPKRRNPGRNASKKVVNALQSLLDSDVEMESREETILSDETEEENTIHDTNQVAMPETEKKPTSRGAPSVFSIDL